MNYCSNQKMVENRLLAFMSIHLLKYFHDFREFFEIVIRVFQKWTGSYWLEPQQHYAGEGSPKCIGAGCLGW
jgi:hypothetical protein